MLNQYKLINKLSDSVNILHSYSISFILRSYLQFTLVKIIRKKVLRRPGLAQDQGPLVPGQKSPGTNDFLRSQDQKVLGLKICKSPGT